MPVPSTLAELSVNPSENSPLGSESPTTADNYFRAHAAFIKQVDEKAEAALGGASSIGIDLAEPTGSALVGFQQSGAGAVARTAESKLMEIASVKDFGVVGGGVADDTAALQAALDSNRIVTLPPGKYRITAPLIVDPIRNRNCGFIGLASASRYPATTQPGGPVWNGEQECVIFYDGPTSTTAAVIRASAEDVGVEPASTFANTLWTFVLNEVTLDANNKAGYGLYAARVQDLQMNHPRARGATVAGMSINGTYSGAVHSPRCYLNPGRGLEIGAADTRFGWTVNDKINALYFYDVHCEANGSSATFRESDPALRKDNCGFYFGPHRGTHVYGVVSENNFGANIVFEPTNAANTLQGVYTELGCRYLPAGAGSDAISLGYATKQWGIIFVGAAAAQNCRMVDGSIASDHIWLTGTEPTAARRESGVEIYNFALAGGVTADWGNYRLVSCSLELENITGVQPAGAFTAKGGLQFEAGGGVLNHYSEGTFTPTLEGLTVPGTGWAYSVQAASFTRVGRLVFVSGRIALTAKSADATGQIAITGLPFTVRNANNFQAAAGVSNVLNMTVNIVQMEGTAQINGTRILLHKRTAATTSAGSVILSDLAANTSFNFSMSYVAA